MIVASGDRGREFSTRFASTSHHFDNPEALLR